ncbi:uncharacterized protein METZ01_LOCUS515092, partial [marine metagenome]
VGLIAIITLVEFFSQTLSARKIIH